MKYLFILVVLGFVFPQHSFSQKNTALDSLMKEYRESGDDTVRVNLLLSIADQYETNNQDSAFYFLEKVKPLAEQLDFKRGLYKYYEQSAVLYFTKGEYRKAMEQSNVALEIAKELGNESFVTNILNNIGIVYQYLGEFEKQLDFSLQALTRIENNGETKKLWAGYHNVANAYFNLNRYRKSIDYCMRSIKAYEQHGGKSYINRVFATLGQCYEQLNQLDSAVFYYQKAVHLSAEVNDKYAEASTYAYMANVYASMYDFASMLKVSESSLTLSRELQSRQMMASSLSNMAFAHYYNHEHDKAKSYIHEALQIAEADSLQDELKNIYMILSYIAAHEGDYKTSLNAKFKSDSIQTAWINAEVLSATTELEAKYESEKREAQILLQQAQLRQKSTMNFILIGALVFILALGVLVYRNYIHRQKLQQQRISELETEKQLSATEAVLKGEEKERARLAKDLHDGLGGMLSGIKYSFSIMKQNLIMTPDNQVAFERSMDMLDSSIKEMRRVAHNMMPEALIRFGLDTALRDFCQDVSQHSALKIDYQSIGMEDVVLDETTTIAIYRIVQELIHNILKHAAATTSVVQLTKIGSKITVTVEDDGKGFDASLLNQAKGMGWSNIQYRVAFLKGKLDVNSKAGVGTSVHIEI